MNKMEILREQLYEMIKTGDSVGILRVSQELDKLVLKYMEGKTDLAKKLA